MILQLCQNESDGGFSCRRGSLTCQKQLRCATYELLDCISSRGRRTEGHVCLLVGGMSMRRFSAPFVTAAKSGIWHPSTEPAFHLLCPLVWYAIALSRGNPATIASPARKCLFSLYQNVIVLSFWLVWRKFIDQLEDSAISLLSTKDFHAPCQYINVALQSQNGSQGEFQNPPLLCHSCLKLRASRS
jgi:hypothetical protein